MKETITETQDDSKMLVGNVMLLSVEEIPKLIPNEQKVLCGGLWPSVKFSNNNFRGIFLGVRI